MKKLSVKDCEGLVIGSVELSHVAESYPEINKITISLNGGPDLVIRASLTRYDQFDTGTATLAISVHES